MAQNFDYDSYFDVTLFPSLFHDIDRAFPELHFRRVGNKWISKYHLNGEKDSQGNTITYIYENSWYMAKDHARNDNKRLIELYEELNNVDFNTAVNALADICKVARPDTNSEKHIKEQNLLHAKSVFVKALWEDTAEANEVRSYLHSRGWTDYKIKKGELGLITTDIRLSLPDGDFYKGVAKDKNDRIIGGIGTTHLLAIPFSYRSCIIGFKFRNLLSRKESIEKFGKDVRFLNSQGLPKSGVFFGMPTQGDDLVIVESELDALSAKGDGAFNVVATAGGKPSPGQIADAKNRNIKKFTLLFDNDEAGHKFTDETIKLTEDAGISIYVASIPDGAKDLDEYLATHTIEDYWKFVVGRSEHYSTYLLKDAVRQYTDKEEKEGLVTPKEKEDFSYKIIDIFNSPRLKPYEREDLYKLLESYEDRLPFKVKDFREWTEKAYHRAQETEKAKTVKDAAAQISDAVNKGHTNEALKLMGETITKTESTEIADKYGDLLKVTSREERLRMFQEETEALRTSYQFTEGKEEKPLALPFTLPTGALTILAAPTSHGKSAFLRNLAIDVARRYKDENKSVLYFTFEESETDVIAQFTNTFIGEQLHAPSKMHTQVECIKNYFKTGNPEYILDSKKEIFKRKEQEFSTDYLDSGKIRIFYRDYDLETLIEALEYAVCNIQTKAIFIDYIQILRSQKFSRQPRTDQLKEICISLKDFSVKYKLPIVLAAQLNREATTPLRMTNTQMAESSDIEKAANTIVCLWNSNFKTRFGKNSMTTEEDNEIKALEKKEFFLGKDGKIFALVTKMRGSRGVGMYSIFDFQGYSGKIVENYNPEAEQQAKQQEIPFENSNIEKAEQQDTSKKKTTAGKRGQRIEEYTDYNPNK